MVSNEKVQNVYDYLSINCRGKKNAVSRTEIARIVNIHEKDLKKAIKVINESDKYDIVISDTHKCYVCETMEEKLDLVNSFVEKAKALMDKANKIAEKSINLYFKE